MNLKAKITDFVVDHRIPELMLFAAGVVIVILMIQDVMAVVRQ